VKEKKYGKSVKKIFWAAFRQDTRTGLIALDSNPEAARGGVSG
jgi:transposase